MSEQSKWESNKNGGGVFIVMSDRSLVFVAEALGATKEIRVKRAAFIVRACNAHAPLIAAIETARKHICGNCFPKPKISCAECWHGEFREQYKAALAAAKEE